MAAVRRYARALLRARWRGALVVAVLVAITGGAVLASLGAARRTETAFPRLLGRINAVDETVFPREFSAFEAESLRDVPGVRRVTSGAGFLIGERRAGRLVGQGIGLVDAIASVDGRAIYETESGRILSGRFPRKDRADEALVNEEGARQLGVEVGDTYRAAISDREFLSLPFDISQREMESHFTPIDLRIVGIARSADDVLSNENSDAGQVVLSPAFARRFREYVIFEVGGVDLREGTSVAEFEAAARRQLRGIEVQFVSRVDKLRTFSLAVQPYADALRIFALVAAVAGFLVLAQALVRLVARDSADGPTLNALGASRAERASASSSRALVAVVTGAGLAVLLAIVASSWFPLGQARRAEPDPGMQLDGWVLGGGFVAIVVVLGLIVLLFAWRRARILRSGAATRRPARAGAFLSGSGAPVSTVTGVGFALQRRGHASASPVATIFGVAIAIITIGAALTYSFNLNRLVTEPDRYGWNWEALVDTYDSGADAALIRAVEDDRDLTGVTVGTRGLVTVGGQSVYAYGLRRVRGDAMPSAITGRLPQAPDEAAIGAQTLRELHRHVGDTLAVSGSDGSPRRIRIVGTTLLPSISLNVLHGLGEGIALTETGLRRVEPEAEPSFFLIDTAASGRTAGIRQRYREADADVLGPQRPGDIRSYASLRSTPLLLAGLLALLGIGVLAHLLVTSVRARRRDLAILQVLGFTRRQVAATVAWQATTLVLVALVIGIPLGIFAGRWTWRSFALDLGIDPVVDAPILVFLALGTGSVLIANAIAIWPARDASHTLPAVELRTESLGPV